MVLHKLVFRLDGQLEPVEKKRQLGRVCAEKNSSDFGRKIADKVGKTAPSIHGDRIENQDALKRLERPFENLREQIQVFNVA
jgi:hypothetical protein